MGELAAEPPPGDAGHEGALGLREPPAEPLSHGQESLDDGTQQPLAFASLGQGPGGERGRGLGVTAELGQVGAVQGNMRRDVHQQAAGRPCSPATPSSRSCQPAPRSRPCSSWPCGSLGFEDRLPAA